MRVAVIPTPAAGSRSGPIRAVLTPESAGGSVAGRALVRDDPEAEEEPEIREQRVDRADDEPGGERVSGELGGRGLHAGGRGG